MISTTEAQDTMLSTQLLAMLGGCIVARKLSEEEVLMLEELLEVEEG